MGAKHTKIEELATDVPKKENCLQLKDISEKTESKHKECNENVCKDTPPRLAENFRKRFFGGFTYLNDPRSPGILNRTPLVFCDDKDKTLNLDDTFSDLFVANRIQKDTAVNFSQEMEIVDNVAPTHTEDDVSPPGEFDEFEKSLSAINSGNESGSIEFTSLCEEETMPCPAVLQQTPSVLQQNLDPRSPTIGVLRTPIIFNDEEALEDAMLEDVLATLSLDMSVASSVNSFETATTSPLMMDIKKPTNKHLERVRAVKKPEKPKRKGKHTSQKQRIYLDTENVAVTPKRKGNIAGDLIKRTPLSCVKNRTHLRSRSVEPNGKSPKPRLSLTSYDDILNPTQNHKVINLHALQGDSLEL